MKVVAISNYALDTVAEKLVASGLTEEEARAKAEELNESVCEGSTYWHVVKSENYILWRGLEELI